MTSILVAGVGNLFAGDDAFGSAVVDRLRAEPLPPGCRVHDYGTAGLHLAYDLVDGVDLLVLVDAHDTGGPPGEVVVLEAGLDALPAVTIDGHGMDPATVLAALADLGADPPRTVVVGCTPATVAEGIGLSGPVEAAVEPACAAVLGIVRSELDADR